MAADIKRILGINTEGYPIEITKYACEHIATRHGTDGQANMSMSDPNDVSRIGWILENYDEAKIGRRTRAYSEPRYEGAMLTRNVGTVEFRKAINGTMLVVVAVPNTKTNRTGIVTAFVETVITKKLGGTSDTVDNNSLKVDVQDASRQVSGDSIARTEEDVKRQLRDPYNASDRELLANALENLAANGDELDILRRRNQSNIDSTETKTMRSNALYLIWLESTIKKKMPKTASRHLNLLLAQRRSHWSFQARPSNRP